MRRRFVKDMEHEDLECVLPRPVGRPRTRHEKKPSAGKQADDPAAAKDQEKKPGRQSTVNPRYVPGRMSTEIKLSAEAFQEMEEQEKAFVRLLTRRAKEQKWDDLKVMQVKGQIARVVRERAILKSNCARMMVDTNYRRKAQEPTGTESIFRYESQAQRQEAILFQMLGMDQMYEAKLGQVESKNKPTDLRVMVGGALDKRHMAAGAGGDDD